MRRISILAFLLACAASAAEPASDAAIAAAVAGLSAGDFSIREEAYARLLDWGAEDPDRVLAHLPQNPDDPEMEAACARLTARLPTESLRRALLALLDGDSPSLLNPGWTLESGRKAVADFFDDPTPRTALDLARLFRSPPPEIADVLFRFRDASDPDLRRCVLSLLVSIDPERARRLLETRLSDAHPVVRLAALEAATLLDGARAIPAIAGKLDDPKRDVRLRAVQNLVSLGPETAPILRAFVGKQFSDMKTMDRNLAAYAIVGLAKMKDREAAPLFASLTDQFDLLVRGTAIWGLGYLGDTRYASAIAIQLGDSEAYIQNCAAAGLAVLSEDAGLLEACKDLLTLGLDGRLEFFLGKEEDLLLGGGSEGERPDAKAIAAAKAWWKSHRADPRYQPQK